MDKEVSFFLKENVPPFVLGAFFSRYILNNQSKKIITQAKFKSSKYEKNLSVKEYKARYLEEINKESYPFRWKLNDTADTTFSAELSLVNDLNLSEESFYNRLYSKILGNCPWVLKEELSSEKKAFIRGFMELRGSIDTTMRLIAQDYFYNSLFEMKRARLLVDYFNLPHYEMNINFRELQRDFYSGINKRNTQLRIGAYWYMKEIGMINKYKVNIFSNAYNLLDYSNLDGVTYFNIEDNSNQIRTKSNILDERLNYYSTNIYGKKISEQEIKEMRNDLGFEKKSGSIRSILLAELIRHNTPDECVCCKDQYNIESRTFTHKRTGKPYLEIHHVISLGQNKELDDENNLVKLCPVCHTCLKKGLGIEREQKNLIMKLLKNAPNVLEFSRHVFDTKNFKSIVDHIFINLN
ncbi:MAG: HNH endonuclease [Caldisericia bacterium]|jgi:hypothetical protein|nr:HNH endonuclease [Caldisericia bacterium]